MLKIQVHGVSAEWNDDDSQWHSPDPNMQSLLNSTVPDDINRVDVPFLQGGQQGVALRAARKFFKSALQVTHRTKPEVPPDVPGMDYSATQPSKRKVRNAVAP